MEKVEKLDNLEKRETPKWRDIKVFRVRHGDSKYNEHLKTDREDEKDLTELGIQQSLEAAKTIESQLDKDNDIICFAFSPRYRTKSTGEVIKNYLNSKGFLIYKDPKEREIQERVRGADLLDYNGSSVEPGEKKHAEIYFKRLKEAFAIMPRGESIAKFWLQGEIDMLEKPSKVKKRTRDQLTFLMRIARKIQPKIDKHIVIIEVEHEETIDELLKVASQGELGILKDSGLGKGEVIQLNIPIKGDEISIKLLDRDIKLSPLHYNHIERIFKLEK